METIKVYKLLRQGKRGTLHPLFIDSIQVLPIGQWLDARAPDDIALQYCGSGFALIDLTRQRPTVFQDHKPRRKQIEQATMNRCRWVEVTHGKQGRMVYDIGLSSDGQVIRFAHRPGWHTCREPMLPGVNMTGKVWAECLIPADDCEVVHRNINGMTAKSQPVEWLISQKIMIVKLLPYAAQPT